ncbi:hypothetical protein GCM10010282_37380 [Streptomyces roseolus]|nr:hypothetical protein GCM10010282_37380 [Streptomyces roseolus]
MGSLTASVIMRFLFGGGGGWWAGMAHGGTFPGDGRGDGSREQRFTKFVTRSIDIRVRLGKGVSPKICRTRTAGASHAGPPERSPGRRAAVRPARRARPALAAGTPHARRPLALPPSDSRH